MLNLDTHIILFAINQTLTRREQETIESNECGCSQIVLWEISKLYELGRIDVSLNDDRFRRLLERLVQWPISLEVCIALRQLDFKRDPADEIIAATSIVHHAPLLTRDRKILVTKVVPLAT